jgi:fumarylacetoacetase
MKSFIDIKQDSDFTLDNIPFGVYQNPETKNPHICSAIGDYVLDLKILEESGLINLGERLFVGEVLNDFMSKGNGMRIKARERIRKLLSENNFELQGNEEIRRRVFSIRNEVKLLMPVNVGDYTDFYSSREHATNVGIMFRGKDNALMPNWLHLPVAYHGRASSVVVSGSPVKRPSGQIRPDDSKPPYFSKSKQLDIELEMGFFISKGNVLGNSVNISDAANHIFGFTLVNDWSARDIQKWEYVPLGPFLGKNFATSVSPWIITPEALEPFKTEGPVQIPTPLDYLKTKGNPTYDIILDIYIKTQKMNEPELIAKSNFKYLYWNVYQQLAHHTVNGCNLRTGDLLASGTISGPDKFSFGSLLELAWKGTEPVKLSNGEERKFLEDYDTVFIRGYCEKDGIRIGFGEVAGQILPAD